MDRFEYCLGVALGFEGGVSNNKADRGGLTNCGVTQRAYDSFRVGKSMQKRAVTLITDAEIKELYTSGYWLPAKCNVSPPPVDLVLFDVSVNSGPKRAIKMLQKALALPDDGSFGPATGKALSSAEPVQTALRMLDAREDFYHAIVAADAGQLVFLKGWLNRTEKLRRIVRRK